MYKITFNPCYVSHVLGFSTVSYHCYRGHQRLHKCTLSTCLLGTIGYACQFAKNGRSCRCFSSVFRWHSHAGLQRGDGISGALIVRQPKDQDPNKGHYDEDKYEHVVVVQDWSHELSVTEFNKAVYGNSGSSPSAILINGKGGQTTAPSRRPKICTAPDGDCPLPQYEQFDVEPGKRFRFRVISTATHSGCGMRVSVDEHNITVIATDGASVQPYECQSFVIYNAERYDFILNANQVANNYWLRVTVNFFKWI